MKMNLKNVITWCPACRSSTALMAAFSTRHEWQLACFFWSPCTILLFPVLNFLTHDKWFVISEWTFIIFPLIDPEDEMKNNVCINGDLKLTDDLRPSIWTYKFVLGKIMKINTDQICLPKSPLTFLLYIINLTIIHISISNDTTW